MRWLSILFAALLMEGCAIRIMGPSSYRAGLGAKSSPTLSFTRFSPTSPSNSVSTPAVIGASSEAGTIEFYSDSSCMFSLGSGSAGSYAGTGISIAVPANSTTQVYGRSVASDGAKSNCQLLGVYVHDATPPSSVSSISNAATNSSLTTTPAISWSGGGTDSLTGFDHYEYSIGTSSGNTSIIPWTSNNSSNSISLSGLHLTAGNTYWVNVRAVDKAGNSSSTTSSSWQALAPSLSTITGTSGIVANGVATSTVTITLIDDYGAPITGQVPTFSATDTGATNVYGTCSASNSLGVSTCTLASTKAESKTLSIVAPISKSGSTVSFINGPAAQLVWSSQPSDALPSTDFSPQPIIQIQDQFGNLCTAGADSSAQVTISIQSGTGALSGTATLSASGGAADFTGKGLQIDLYGKKKLLATKASTTGIGGVGVLTQASSFFYITPVVCDSGNLTSSSPCTLSAAHSMASGSTLLADTSLVIANGGSIQNTNNVQSVAMNLSGNLTIQSGGLIHANLNSVSAANIDIQSGGSINADTLGYYGSGQGTNNTDNGFGPGGGVGSTIDSAGGGGGHGGAGGTYGGATGGAANDSATDPTDYGSGGAKLTCGGPGGNGGGVVRLSATGTLTLNGAISANGGGGGGWCLTATGGGAGGAVKLTATTVAGSGSISVAGGTGAILANAGGGGRVAIVANNVFGGSIDYRGANEGSYSMQLPTPDALCDTGDFTTGCTISSSKLVPRNLSIHSSDLTIDTAGTLKVPNTDDFINLTVDNTLTVKGTLSASVGTLSATDVVVTPTGRFYANLGSPDTVTNPGLTATNVNIQSGGVLSADGLGYAGAGATYKTWRDGLGSGPGVSPSNGGSGGGHGGAGGNSYDGAPGGSTYDSAVNPTDYGSGGGASACCNPGGAGGGLLLMNVSGTLTVDGTLSANGISYITGGGGGSINLTVGSIAGSGSIQANGGARMSVQNGAGGGGRIRLSANKPFAGTIQYNGATEGTFTLQLPSGDAICDSGSLAATCVISSIKTLPTGYTIAAQNLQIDAGGNLKTPGPFDALILNITNSLSISGWITSSISTLTADSVTIASGGGILGNIGSPNTGSDPGATVTNFTIQSGGLISADKSGYLGGGWGWATIFTTDGQGPAGGVFSGATIGISGGGGHGGAGGNGSDVGATGGSAYDSGTDPSDYGSGGGSAGCCTMGSRGGGLVHLNVTGTLTVDGAISADGVWELGAGGAAGGSINLNVGSIAGSGSIHANGGPGGSVNGGGGGGIVAIVHASGSPWAGTTQANGGTGGTNGAAGVIYAP